MKLLELILSLTLFPLLSLAACDKNDDDQGSSSDDETTQANMADMGNQGSLQWYTTCGDPVCSGYSGPWDGVPPCGQNSAGTACQTAGATCDFMSDCNAQLICATEDPKQQPGGCPISRARFKQDIDYLDADARRAYYRELLELRLATYRYRERQDRRTMLGVILEDVEHSIVADPANDRVDLYGYGSLAIAGIQTQAEELEALRAELDALRSEVADLREQAAACQSPAK